MKTPLSHTPMVDLEEYFDSIISISHDVQVGVFALEELYGREDDYDSLFKDSSWLALLNDALNSFSQSADAIDELEVPPQAEAAHEYLIAAAEELRQAVVYERQISTGDINSTGNSNEQSGKHLKLYLDYLNRSMAELIKLFE